MSRPLAILRPEPGNSATAGRIEALGLQAIRLPLFAVRALDWTPPDPADHDALLLTSANAVRFGGPHLADLLPLPVLAVGEKTAEAGRLAGFDVMAAGNGDAAFAAYQNAYALGWDPEPGHAMLLLERGEVDEGIREP